MAFSKDRQTKGIRSCLFLHLPSSFYCMLCSPVLFCFSSHFGNLNVWAETFSIVYCNSIHKVINEYQLRLNILHYQNHFFEETTKNKLYFSEAFNYTSGSSPSPFCIQFFSLKAFKQHHEMIYCMKRAWITQILNLPFILSS